MEILGGLISYVINFIVHREIGIKSLYDRGKIKWALCSWPKLQNELV